MKKDIKESLLNRSLKIILGSALGCVVALGLTAPMQALAADKGGDPNFNPKASADDVIVPMPCGAQMAFRKVYTGNNQKLTDKSFSAGSTNADSLLTQAPNQRYIQGAFHDNKGYYYLISKYELTSAQYDILNSYELGKGKCASKKLGIKDRIAKGNLSWFDAIELTRQYSYYLASPQAQEDVKALGSNAQVPKASDNTIAFARLPTDSEWEYAARGGEAISAAQFSADVFPFASGKNIASYAWYKGSDSAADGKVRVVGLKDPNPLGLYDILGNVSEITLEPFYATRTGRLHGQSGGFVVRGGSVINSKSDMITAYRVERSYYTKGKETSSSDVGMRMVLALPFTTNINEVRALSEELKKLGTEEVGSEKSSGNATTLAQLDKIIAEQKEATKKAQAEAKQAQVEAEKLKAQVKKSKEASASSANSLETAQQELEATKAQLLKTQEQLDKQKQDHLTYAQTMDSSLNDIRNRLIAANARTDEMRDRAIVSALRLGGYLCSSVADQQIQREQNERREQILRATPPSECYEDEKSDKCVAALAKQDKIFEKNRALLDKMVDFYVTYYADHITTTLDTYELKHIKAQLDNGKKALGYDEGSLPEYIEQFLKDVEKYQKGSRDLDANKKTWVKQCRALKR